MNIYHWHIFQIDVEIIGQFVHFQVENEIIRNMNEGFYFDISKGKKRDSKYRNDCQKKKNESDEKVMEEFLRKFCIYRESIKVI